VKVGDFVRFATGRGRETDVGLLILIEDNPGELITYPLVPARKIGHVMSHGTMHVAWLEHIHPEPIPEEYHESR